MDSNGFSNLKYFLIDGSERAVQDILSKLDFISKIREGEKVDISSMSVCSNDWKTSLYRTLFARNESRKATLEWLRSIYADAFMLIDVCLGKSNEFYSTIASKIAESIMISKQGLISLRETYSTDRLFVSKIETLISTLEAKRNDLTKFLEYKSPNTSNSISNVSQVSWKSFPYISNSE